MKKAKERTKFHVKLGDTVIVVSGRDKGTVGNIKEAIPKKGKVVVEGVNVITKAIKANPMKNVQGGLVKLEAPINSSKVMLYCIKCEKPTRIKFVELEDGSKARICKRCNEQLDV